MHTCIYSLIQVCNCVIRALAPAPKASTPKLGHDHNLQLERPVVKAPCYIAETAVSRNSCSTPLHQQPPPYAAQQAVQNVRSPMVVDSTMHVVGTWLVTT
jgi:hypothetical protein